MNMKKPVQLSQKIDYLNQKISKVHSQIRKTEDLELRLNFEQFIDNCIRQIIAIRDHSSPNKNSKRDNVRKDEGVNDSKYYTAEKEKIEFQKKIVNYQMKQLENRQLQIDYQSTKIKLFNKEKELQKLQYEKNQLKMESAMQIKRLSDKNKFVEQQIEKVVKLNKAQEEEIKIVKQQRNRAQQKQLELQEKYDEDVGKLQKFGEKKPRYIDRNTQGLKCIVYYTNNAQNTTKPGSNSRIIILKLPTVIQVNKLVYGVMIGVQANGKEILYYDKFQLYQKEITHIEVQNESLVLTYKRRKQSTRIVLDKYIVRVPEVVIMLYGKGDSIIVHDEPRAKEK